MQLDSLAMAWKKKRERMSDCPSGIPSAPNIKPIREWGNECRRGFVSNARFSSSALDLVIPRTNRSAQKKKRAKRV